MTAHHLPNAFGGLPGLCGVDHVGLTVPDIDAATKWFVDVLGAVRFYDLGPFEDPDSDSMQTSFGLHPRTRVERIRMLRLVNLNIELFQMAAPDQRSDVPRMSDAGGFHLALYVRDIDHAIAHIRAAGATVYGDKLPLPGQEAGRGNYFVYFQSPWGGTFELISYPGGKQYEQEGEPRLWDPSRPDLALNAP